MKHVLATATCAVVLVAGLTACGSGSEKTAPPRPTDGPGPSPTANSGSAPTQTAAAPSGTPSGPTALAAHSTYTYGDLKVVVNLPADIPSPALPSVRVLSDFLQAVARTTARNKPDPALASLAKADVVKYVHTFVEKGSIQGAGSVTFTVRRVQTGRSGYGVITGCLDQSGLVQIRKDGTRFVDAMTKKYPTLKLTAETNPGPSGPTVSLFTYAPGTC